MSEETKLPSPSRGVPVHLDRVRYLRFPLSVLRSLGTEQEASSTSGCPVMIRN
jgi:hypothetical protein